MSGMYWGLTAMALMGRLDEMDCGAVAEWVVGCRREGGGFGASPRNDAHMLYTLSAVQVRLGGCDLGGPGCGWGAAGGDWVSGVEEQAWWGASGTQAACAKRRAAKGGSRRLSWSTGRQHETPLLHTTHRPPRPADPGSVG